MKKYFIIFFVVIGGIVSSCYKDQSTVATETIPDIVFGDEQDVISISFGETLVIDPKVSQEGRGPEDFSYLWEMTLQPNNSNHLIEVGREPVLEMQIANEPSASPYYIFLTVTDNTTGYVMGKNWLIYVGSSMGEGLLVATTSDGGTTSDIDFVSSSRVTYSYEGDGITYLRNIYSLANSSKYQGRINSMCYNIATDGASYNTSRMLIGSDTEIFSMNLLTMERELESTDLIMMASDTEYNVSEIFNYAGNNTGAVINNRLYGMLCSIDDSFVAVGFSLEPNNVIYEGCYAYAKPQNGDFCLFSSLHDGYYWTPGWSSAVSGSISAIDVPSSYSIANSSCLGAGPLQDCILGYVVKANTGSYSLSTFDFEENPTVYSEYSLSGTDIENAISFAFCDNANLFYYATPDHIYANVVTGDRITTRQVSWSPDSADEKITKIIHYQQAWYGTQLLDTPSEYDFVLPTHQLQMLIVTYNESTGEGKIYLKPFNVNTGLFSMTDEGEVFDGFGEITAIASTPR